jgi:hypothetical protein
VELVNTKTFVVARIGVVGANVPEEVNVCMT